MTPFLKKDLNKIIFLLQICLANVSTLDSTHQGHIDTTCSSRRTAFLFTVRLIGLPKQKISFLIVHIIE